MDPVIERFVRIYASRDHITPPQVRRVLRSLKVLSEDNPDSISFLVGRLERTDRFTRGRLRRLSFGLIWSAHFLDRYREKFVIEGPVLAFFYSHHGRRDDFKYLTMLIRRGRVAKITFYPNGHYEIQRRPVNREGEGPFRGYEEAPEVRFLPNPDNDWGAGDLSLSRSGLSGRLQALFDRIADRLELGRAKLACRMQDAGLDDFYSIRLGQWVLLPQFLTDSFLDEVGFDQTEREELRHLETLLRINQILARGGPSLGPAAALGARIRYWRVLAGLEVNAVEEAANRSRQGPALNLTLVEGGWCLLRDRQSLVGLMELLHVPRILRDGFLGYLSEGYGRVAASQEVFAPKGLAKVFPNPEWDIPFYGLDEETLRKELGLVAWTIRDSAGMTQEEFGRGVLRGLGAKVVADLELQGQLSPVTFRRYEAYLKRQRERSLLQELRLLRAALELLRNPLREDGALLEVGRLLRYVRHLIPGATVEVVLKALKLPISSTTYLEFEQGHRPMPHDYLVKFAWYLQGQRAFSWEQVEPFIERVESIYAAMEILILKN